MQQYYILFLLISFQTARYALILIEEIIILFYCVITNYHPCNFQGLGSDSFNFDACRWTGRGLLRHARCNLLTSHAHPYGVIGLYTYVICIGGMQAGYRGVCRVPQKRHVRQNTLPYSCLKI